jgi:P27 family predicted phage terminase small subunit
MLRPPKTLNKEATAEWNRLAPKLDALGLLTDLDVDLVAAYCFAVSDWKRARAEIDRLGPVVKSPSGYPIQSPHVSLARHALKEMTRLGAEIGWSARARDRMGYSEAKVKEALDALELPKY